MRGNINSLTPPLSRRERESSEAVIECPPKSPKNFFPFYGKPPLGRFADFVTYMKGKLND